MGHASLLSPPVLEQFLIQARLTKAVVSLRLQGTPSRLLGDLRIHAFRVGSALDLSGLHARDLVPAAGTPVTLTILLGDEVLTLQSALLPAAGTDESGAALLRLDWPQEPARLHHRRDVRVAAPDQSPLKVKVKVEGRQLEALLVNLTETGVGLALEATLMVELHAMVDIDAELPDGSLLRCPAEVRHLTYIEGQTFPTRLGLVLRPGDTTDMAPIHRFIQTRRTDRSHSFRQN
ncbi:PilZ domain-containing protein [Geothrix sp. PMB-07]|uniref:PilZ domain-containing protein n=1 Tax=Geothrix sp. PMB-07 TaxID=3068640 RepID=UPI002742444C|nr:PilZ domain-containing protein [Geothrix sp. PMB-07]WLT30370.1 PilZ domain-containing protein [Geothrix sp. PMB-07]